MEKEFDFYQDNGVRTFPLNRLPGAAAGQVAVMLSRHMGVVCEPTVKKNEQVQAGQKIGDSDAFVSAPIRLHLFLPLVYPVNWIA